MKGWRSNEHCLISSDQSHQHGNAEGALGSLSYCFFAPWAACKRCTNEENCHKSIKKRISLGDELPTLGSILPTLGTFFPHWERSSQVGAGLSCRGRATPNGNKISKVRRKRSCGGNQYLKPHGRLDRGPQRPGTRTVVGKATGLMLLRDLVIVPPDHTTERLPGRISYSSVPSDDSLQSFFPHPS